MKQLHALLEFDGRSQPTFSYPPLNMHGKKGREKKTYLIIYNSWLLIQPNQMSYSKISSNWVACTDISCRITFKDVHIQMATGQVSSTLELITPSPL